MSASNESPLEVFLHRYDGDGWASVVAELLPDVHPVDKNAVRIWFAFFPLDLAREFENAEDPEKLEAELLILGNYRLESQIDSSHRFLYGHRYWPEVKKAIIERARLSTAPGEAGLSAEIREIARNVAAFLRVDASLLVGITAVALMTLEQVGLVAFEAEPGRIGLDPAASRRPPQQVLAARARDDRQGPFGFLRGRLKIWTVSFDENDPEARFPLIDSQELTTAAANDKRDYASKEPRCMPGEGPIPVQCRSAACGTCWIGVLGGENKLSEVTALERRRIREFGYIDTDDPKPLIRLACMAQATGAVSIAIPPWNGVFGTFLQKREKATRAIEGL